MRNREPNMTPCFSISYQIRMILYRLFDSLWLYANIPLRGAGTAMLQKPLHQGNIEAIGIVDLCCIPLAKAVGADSLEAQVITDNMQLLLNGPFCNGEHQFCAPNVVAQTVVFDVLVYDHGNSEHSAFACLLLHHFQTIPITIPHNIALPELQNVADAQPQVSFQNQSRGDPLIGSATTEALLHSLDNFLVLLCCQSLGFLVHSCLQ